MANLSHADLNGANLENADLRGATLNHTNFRNANLSNVDFIATKIKDTRFGNNLGISQSLKSDLVARGAIFEDSLDDVED